jgi:hypothetical protein
MDVSYTGITVGRGEHAPSLALLTGKPSSYLMWSQTEGLLHC